MEVSLNMSRKVQADVLTCAIATYGCGVLTTVQSSVEDRMMGNAFEKSEKPHWEMDLTESECSRMDRSYREGTRVEVNMLSHQVTSTT